MNRVTVAHRLYRLTDSPYKWTPSRNGLTDGTYMDLLPEIDWLTVHIWSFFQKWTDSRYVRIFSRNGLTDSPYMDFLPERNGPYSPYTSSWHMHTTSIDIYIQSLWRIPWIPKWHSCQNPKAPRLIMIAWEQMTFMKKWPLTNAFCCSLRAWTLHRMQNVHGL